MKKTLSLTLSLIIVAIVFASCSASGRSSGSPGAAGVAPPTNNIAETQIQTETDKATADLNAPNLPETPSLTTGGGETAVLPTEGQLAASNRKIISNYDITMQTIEFDKGTEYIASLTTQFGGFTEKSYLQGKDMYSQYGQRYATYSIRIPADKVTAFVDRLSEKFNITSKQQYSNDITGEYYDTQARLKSLRLQEELLISMLEKSDTLEYLFEIQRELADVRYEIEAITTSINRMDEMVSLSTVTLNLNEVAAYQVVENAPITFSDRVQSTFASSTSNFSSFLQGALIFIIAIFPFLIFLAVVLVIVIFIRRALKNHRNLHLKKTKPPSQYDSSFANPYPPYNNQPQAPFSNPAEDKNVEEDPLSQSPPKE